MNSKDFLGAANVSINVGALGVGCASSGIDPPLKIRSQGSCSEHQTAASTNDVS